MWQEFGMFACNRINNIIREVSDVGLQISADADGNISFYLIGDADVDADINFC